MTTHDRFELQGEENWGARRPGQPLERGGRGSEAKLPSALGRPRVLGRVPNLDQAELDRVLEADTPPSSRRKLQQRVSAAILLGGAGLLLIVACAAVASPSFPEAEEEKTRRIPPRTPPWRRLGTARRARQNRAA